MYEGEVVGPTNGREAKKIIVFGGGRQERRGAKTC